MAYKFSEVSKRVRWREEWLYIDVPGASKSGSAFRKVLLWGDYSVIVLGNDQDDEKLMIVKPDQDEFCLLRVPVTPDTMCYIFDEVRLIEAASQR